MKTLILHAIHKVLGFLTPIRLLVIAVAVAFFGFLALGDQGLYSLRQLLKMQQQLSQERDAVNDDIDRLSREQEMLSTADNLEMVIRKELGYIKPGEIMFEEKPADQPQSARE